MALSIAPAIAGCNSGNAANSDLLSSANCLADASGSSGVAVGLSAWATGSASTALGTTARAQGASSTSLGAFTAQNAGVVEGATSVGAIANLNGAGMYSSAFGAGKGINTGTQSAGAYSIAIGGGDGADFTPAGGDPIDLNGARASGFISTAIGTASEASGGGSIAIGLGSKATANDSAAFGEFSLANGEGSVAVGLFSQTDGKFSLALGHGATATRVGAVAVGNGSVAKEQNVVSVGSAGTKRRIVNVAAGIAPNDAVTVAQLQAATAAANAQREVMALRALVERLETRIAQLEGRAAAPARAE